jgi:hypothetical protein
VDTRESISRHTLAGLVIVIVLAGGVGGWAGTMTLSGALIAQGSVVVDSNVKKVQHPTGGIVGELRVKDGDRVQQATSWFVSTTRSPAPISPSSPKDSTNSTPARRAWRASATVTTRSSFRLIFWRGQRSRRRIDPRWRAQAVPVAE